MRAKSELSNVIVILVAANSIIPGRKAASHSSRDKPYGLIGSSGIETSRHRKMNIPKKGTAGSGGHASVEGDDSRAEGGEGGEAVFGDGARGGHARVKGNNSAGVGGKAGRGGVGPGQPGMDVEVIGDDTFVVGGEGGEARQIDGRGGRGG